jgi:DNA-binding transcriptional MerR regulator
VHQDSGNNGRLRIGEMARRAGTSTDTIRYYERLGLLPRSGRTASGYRQYTDVDVRRLQFIRRAKLLGLSLDEVRSLLDLAEAGECQPLRHEVVELLAQKIAECERRQAELVALQDWLTECRRVAIQRQEEPACCCAEFASQCECLPLPAGTLSPRL